MFWPRRKLSTGPAVDPRMCVGSVVSKGRLFDKGHGSGLQMSQVSGPEAVAPAVSWETPPKADP